MTQNPMITLPREAVESLLNNPPGHPDAVKAREDLLAHLSMAEQISAAEPSAVTPSETALRRAMLYLKRCDTGCNEVKTLRQLAMSAQHPPRSITAHVSAISPGNNLVAFRLPESEPVPAWLDLGEKIKLVEIPAPEVNDEQ